MDEKISKLREIVKKASANPDFVHHKWFVKYHLEIVEEIALTLAENYSEADKDLLLVMVWLHDYGKILDFDNSKERLFEDGKKLLEESGFDEELIKKVMNYLEMFESKMDLDLSSDETPIEVKVVSSADGVSHFIGPFFFMWWYENAHKPFEKLMQDNRKKADKDWNRKIVLPEAKEMVKERYGVLMEMVKTR